MIFKTTDDGGLTNIFKELKSVQVTFEELDKTTLRSAIKSFNNTSISVDDLSQKFGGLDDSVVTYLNNTTRGQASIDGLSKSVDKSATSMASATIKAQILSVALNALTGLAISLAIKGITWAVDELIVTLDEQKEKLDDAVNSYEESKTELASVNDELKTATERIDELNSKDNLTFTEQDELEKLIKTNDELERKIYLLEQANKEAEKEVATEAQNTYDKYINDRNIGAVEQIDFYSESSLLDGSNWDNYKNDLSWLVAQYRNQQEILLNAQENGWTAVEEKTKSNLELLEGYMSEASLDYQDLYEKIGNISDVAMTDELKVAEQDLDNILDIVAEILGYGGERSNTSFDDIWNSEEFSKYKSELESISKEGKLDASVLESNENYKKLLENTGATAKDTAQHINALVNEMEHSGSTNYNKIDISLSGISLQSIERYDAQIKEAQQALENEYKKIQDWGLGNYTHQIKHDTIQSVFGNVDMDKRTIITWSDELKKTYKKQLASWNYNPEVGGIDTVFGGSARFGEGLNDIGWEVAFTPILPDGTFLDKDTVYDYIESIIADAYANDGKVTEDELKTLDAQGKQMGEVFVNGIFAGVDDGLNYENNGNWAETIGRLMHFSGDYGAVEIAKRNINEIQAQKNELISKVSNLTIDELKNSTSSFTTAQESLNTALEEQNETGRISSETLTTLRDNFEGINDIIEETTNGIIINTDKLANLNKAEREKIETGLALKEEELVEQFNEASLQLATYESIMKNTTSTDENYLETLRNTINATREQKDAISEQIGELNLLQLEYENSISKHNRFIEALSTKDAGSGYDDVTSGLEQVEKEWNAGNVGKDEIRNFVDYMSYNDMSTASIDEVKNSYQKAMEMAKMYFTESSEGSRRFLELLEDTEVEGKKLATNTDGIWNIDIDDIEKAAQAIGVSTEFIQDQMMKLKDKGFEVEFETDTDGLVDYSAELEKVAEKIAVLEKQQSFGDKTEATAEKLKELYAYRDSIEISVETQEVEYAIQRIQELQKQIYSTSNTDAKVGMQQQQQNIIDELNQKTGGNYTVETIVGVDTQDATARFELFKQQVEEAGIKSEVVLTPDTSQFDSVKNEIQTHDIVAGVKLEVTDENISTRLTNIIKNAGKKDSGGGESDDAGWTGSAFAQGKWTVRGSGKSLVGELGTEILVRNGRYHTIGENGAEFIDVKKDDIIFNH